ncbi:MAG: energy transducer TonB [Deltaproteobacteria bacterium]|nr:energy transducer TonB [Deltaproteobacteria bacterium]
MAAVQGGAGFFPALGLSGLLHCGLLLLLVLHHAPESPPVEDAGGGIRFSLVSLSGFSDGGQAALAEDKAALADRRLPVALPSAASASRIKAAQAGKNPPRSTPQPATKKPATTTAEDAAQDASAAGPESAADVRDGGSRSPASGLASDVGGGADAGPGAELPGLSANLKPTYPELARLRGQEGLVMLLAEVDAQGAAKSVSIQRSSGHSLLDEAAVSAVQRWRFRPARLAGAATAGRVLVPVEFRLHP